ncbi:MAG: Ldh family oxidoreductase [Halomonas sp.]|uniref:Ldh family oxidoreductase n=1 Tax=Halomonas sp. TaxID=1486246 RepID=UPI002ACE3661|nr:Ldh family oxidoreductase [Halomonas sp.]MDZ7852593.1 Ldh family oxidoreductase [Halomonas sp.]
MLPRQSRSGANSSTSTGGAKTPPKDWPQVENGTSQTDTGPLLKDLVTGAAAMLPLGGAGELYGGHKGYGYGTMVEILSAALSGGSYLWDLAGFDDTGTAQPFRLGHFFLAVDVAHFIEPAEFRRIATDILQKLQQSKKAPGHDRIYVAGEKEYEIEQQRRADGIPDQRHTSRDAPASEKRARHEGVRLPVRAERAKHPEYGPATRYPSRRSFAARFNRAMCFAGYTPVGQTALHLR